MIKSLLLLTVFHKVQLTECFVVIGISLHIIGIKMCLLWELSMVDTILILCISILILSIEKSLVHKSKDQFLFAKEYSKTLKHVNFIQHNN
jgi:type IV secretory pathway VirB3-like protein